MGQLIGTILMVIGGINIIWFLLWSLLAWSGTVGAKISKKIGTDNEHTDKAIAMGKNFGKRLLTSAIVSAVLSGIGAIIFFVFK